MSQPTRWRLHEVLVAEKGDDTVAEQLLSRFRVVRVGPVLSPDAASPNRKGAPMRRTLLLTLSVLVPLALAVHAAADGAILIRCAGPPL